jgi:hypothetical protein
MVARIGNGREPPFVNMLFHGKFMQLSKNIRRFRVNDHQKANQILPNVLSKTLLFYDKYT